MGLGFEGRFVNLSTPIGSAPVGGSDVDWTDGENKLKTTSSVSISSDDNYAETIGNDVYFYVSGSRGNNGKSVFGGDVIISGSLYYSNYPTDTNTIIASQMFSGR